jgi:hypothetical protein
MLLFKLGKKKGETDFLKWTGHKYLYSFIILKILNSFFDLPDLGVFFI